MLVLSVIFHDMLQEISIVIWHAASFVYIVANKVASDNIFVVIILNRCYTKVSVGLGGVKRTGNV